MRPALAALAASVLLAGLSPQSAPEPEGLRIYSPEQFGVAAATPSRIAGSRDEMNRGRSGPSGPSRWQHWL